MGILDQEKTFFDKFWTGFQTKISDLKKKKNPLEFQEQFWNFEKNIDFLFKISKILNKHSNINYIRY